MRFFKSVNKKKKWALATAACICLLSLLALTAMFPFAREQVLTPHTSYPDSQIIYPTEDTGDISTHSTAFTDASKYEGIESSGLTDGTLVNPEQDETEQRGGLSTHSTIVTRPDSGQTTAGSQTTSKIPAGGTSATTQATTKPTQQPTAPRPTVPPAESTYSKRLVGYYTGWSAAKGWTPDKIAVKKLTHIHYAFAKIDPSTMKIALDNPAQDMKNFAVLRRLKEENPKLRTLISVGGWDHSTYFSDVAATAAGRTAFAKSCVEFIVEYGFDGVDLDWEYPVSGGAQGNHHRPQDKQNFTLLLQELRTQLDKQGQKDGRTYSLAIAGAADSGYLNKIELQKVMNLVDYLFIMAYDMHGPWDTYTDLLAPLYTPNESSPQYKSSVDNAISTYLNGGAPAKKLVLGMPFYGYLYKGADTLYSRYSSASAIS